MRGWISDAIRTAGALWYWNVRKSIFVLRRRRGQCPCHNPSDSGRAFETGCEAMLLWNDPARFARRVCPLLARNPRGDWTCSVAAAKVRPFWRRVFGYYGGGFVVLVLILGLLALGGMRAIGYRATLRQVFWPPAWKELREVRAQYFVNKAEELIRQGRAREAALSLATAYETSPNNYVIGMAVAQFDLVWRPDLVDRIYNDLLTRHPVHRAETADAWLHSLLARGELEGVAVLARRELKAGVGDPAPWSHALIVAARLMNKPDLLEDAAQDAVPAPVRAVLRLEARTREVPPDEARRLLMQGDVSPNFPYADFERIERLLQLGDAPEALILLRAAQHALAGRDVARLVLAAYAVAGEKAALRQQAGVLLAPTRSDSAGVGLVALHLITYPDAELLRACVDALSRTTDETPETRADTIVDVYFAAVCARETQYWPELRKLVAQAHRANAGTLENFEQLMAKSHDNRPLRAVLPLVQPMTLELNYTLLEKSYARLRPETGN